MPNARWNNMHGANDRSGGGQPAKTPGSPAKVNLGSKQRDRSGGAPKSGPLGPFYVKKEGL